MINATGDPAASYTIANISLEFDKVTQPDLARTISNQYAGRVVILYERVLRHRKVVFNKSDGLWNVNLNVPAKSMKGILLLFEAPSGPYVCDKEAFCNPKISKVEVTIEGGAKPTLQQGNERLSTVGRGSKILCGSTLLATASS